MILPIVIEPNTILHKKTRTLTSEELKSPKIKELIANMKETMANANGVGLAAPQINEALRITVIDTGDGITHTLINPRILLKSFWQQGMFEEGCLSIPGVYGNVKRPMQILVTYQDENGASNTKWVGSMMARVMQHEIDHLNGILFTERTKDITNPKQITPDYPHM